MPPKILLVDDEKLARERLVRFIHEIDPSAELEEAANGVLALEKVKSFSPDVVFLDIQMPGLNGFEVLQQIDVRNFQVVFQTAYDEFAIKAFDENACDYLLKPFTVDRLRKALGKALKQKSQSLESLEKQISYLERLVIKQNGRAKVIAVESIDYLMSKDHYTCIYVAGEESVCELSLNWLEPRLDPRKFMRIHRNCIVPLQKIKSVGGSAKCVVELTSGISLEVSRAKRKLVLEGLR